MPNIHKPFYDRYGRCPKWEPTHSFHTFYFPDGEVICGNDCSQYRLEQLQKLNFDVKDKSVLEIGSWSGFFAFEMEKMGAKRVLATDWFCWSMDAPGPGTKHVFDYVKKKLNSKVEELEIDVPDITIDKVGKFDMLLLLGITYHLPSVCTSIVNLCELANEVLIESAIDLSIPQEFACSRLYIKDIYCNDPSNFFIGNPKFYEDILSYCGFKTIRQHLYKIGEWDRLCMYGEK